MTEASSPEYHLDPPPTPPTTPTWPHSAGNPSDLVRDHH